MDAGMISFLAGLTVLLAVYTIASVKATSTVSRARRKGDDEGGIGGTVRSVADEFLPSIPGVYNLSAERRSEREKFMIRSGNPWKLRAEEFQGVQLLFGVLGALMGILLVFSEALPVPGPLVILAFGLMGYVFPYSTYNTAREKRAKQIRKELPEALDLLVITMKSGMNFSPALAEVSPRLPDGLVKEQLSLVSSQIQSGYTVESALSAFADSAASDEAEAFAKAVAQAQKLGSDVSETLTAQATAARASYEAMLDKKIAKLSTWMFAFLSPTMIPALMIVFAAPSLVSMADGFFGM